MARPVIGEILIRLVADVVDASLATQAVDRPQVGFGVHHPGRVVGRDRHHRPGPLGDGPVDGVDLELVVGIGRHAHGSTVDHADCHLVVEIVGQRQNDFVARIGNRHQGVHEGHIAPGRHHDTLPVIERHAVVVAQLVGDDLQQRVNALDEFVLMVVGVGLEVADGVKRLGRRAVVGDALAQRQRAGGGADQLGDHRNDGRLHRLHAPTFAQLWHVRRLSRRSTPAAQGKTGVPRRGGPCCLRCGYPPRYPWPAPGCRCWCYAPGGENCCW